jgi:hypothetical protein
VQWQQRSSGTHCKGGSAHLQLLAALGCLFVHQVKNLEADAPWADEGARQDIRIQR